MIKCHQLTDAYFVGGQIVPEDVLKLQAMGVSTVINNRPDFEVPAYLQDHQMQPLFETAGITYVFNPVDSADMKLHNIEQQREALKSASGNVLAYCTSGMRSALMWAFAQAGCRTTQEIIEICQNAGFGIGGMHAQIDRMAAHRMSA